MKSVSRGRVARRLDAAYASAGDRPGDALEATGQEFHTGLTIASKIYCVAAPRPAAGRGGTTLSGVAVKMCLCGLPWCPRVRVGRGLRS